MDLRAAQRYSKSETSLPSQAAHIISQKSLPGAYPHPSNRNSRQRWSVAPTSSLAIVETIDYDDDDAESLAVTTTAGKEKSKAQFRGLMRQLFSWKPKELPSTNVNIPTITVSKSVRTPKKDMVVVKSSEPKEGNRWNRFSIIVRPPRKSEQPTTTPKRVDSGVDVTTLKELEGEEGEKENEREEKAKEAESKREKENRRISRNTIYSATSIHSQGSSFRTAVASRASFASDASPSTSTHPLDLTPVQLAHLLAQVKTGITMINAQTSQAESFSKNLAGLLWDKEHSINANKLLPAETKTTMLATLGKVREQTARTFCRKGIFFERSLATLERLREVVEAAKLGEAECTASAGLQKADIDANTLALTLTQTHTDSISDNDGNSTQRSASPSSDTTLTNDKRSSAQRLTLTLSLLQSTLSTLKADLTAHSHLDPALRNTVVQPTQESRFPSTEKERVAMRRFVRFVDGRVKKLGEGEWEVGRWVRGVEGWVWGLED